MQEDPKCPKCKNNRRVIASHKKVAYNPGRIKQSVVWTLLKIVGAAQSVWTKCMSTINYIQRQKYLFQCNTCTKEFQGIRQKRK